MTSLVIHGWANTAEGQAQTTVSVTLDRPCRDCDGKGVVYSEAWREWNEKYDAARGDAEANDNLEQDAFGKYLDPTLRLLEQQMEDLPRSEEEPCGQCEGVGSIPTAKGMTLLAFVRKYAS